MQNDQLYHSLVWQPGKWLHDDWWCVIGLQEWKEAYVNMTESARWELDNILQQRRNRLGFRATSLLEFTPIQEVLLRAFERLPMLLVALGISLSQCPDYLLWRPYRQALSLHLTEEQMAQLQALWRGGERSPDIEPDALIIYAQRLGISALHLVLVEDPVWQAVRYTLPDCTVVEHSTSYSPVPFFLRLDRFL